MSFNSDSPFPKSAIVENHAPDDQTANRARARRQLAKARLQGENSTVMEPVQVAGVLDSVKDTIRYYAERDARNGLWE